MKKSLLLCALLLLALASKASAQQIRITAPASRSSLSLGQSVAVDVSTSVPFKTVGVIASDDLPDLGALNSAPYQFTLNVPTNVPYGQYQLTAVGVDAKGSLTFSDPVRFSVEPTLAVTALAVQPSQLKFHYLGERIPLLVTGTLADGSQADLTHSFLTTYAASSPAVVSVDSWATAAATGASEPGASVTIARGALSTSIPVTIPASERGDLNGDGAVDMNDLNILLQALNTPAVQPVDARDLNGDGRIDLVDARILVSLCSGACAIPCKASCEDECRDNHDKERVSMEAADPLHRDRRKDCRRDKDALHHQE